MTATEMQELMTREEELIPELQFFVSKGPLGWMIHHKWVSDFAFDPKHAARINFTYRCKAKAVATALFEQQWISYIYLHERPYRLDALQRIMSQLNQDEKYELIASVWQDSENIWQNRATWLRIFRGLAEPRRMMNPEEWDKFNYMGDRVQIFRGDHSADRVKKGLSWTVDEDKARWFASRFKEHRGGGAFLGKVIVPKDKVLAFFDDRGEAEVIVLPPFKNLTVEELK